LESIRRGEWGFNRGVLERIEITAKSLLLSDFIIGICSLAVTVISLFNSDDWVIIELLFEARVWGT
jgi:hypothetical protein